MKEDMICALSTPLGMGALSVIRLSGEGSIDLVQKLFSVKDMKPRRMYHGLLADDGVIDDCMAVVFAGPKSFTGEDMAELYLHGGMMPQKRALKALISHGARLAQPGEFSKRAFMNGKLDLAEAEGVIDLICAQTEAQAKNALSALRGGISQRVEECTDALTDILAAIEAIIEYPEEDFEEDANADLIGNIDAVRMRVLGLLDTFETGDIIKNGYRVAIAGLPNVGKSSLLNALLGVERAIVTKNAGTTRDVLDELTEIGGLPVRFMDTAGLRDTSDEAEAIGIERARQAVEDAQLVILVTDATRPMTAEEAELWQSVKERGILAQNKADIAGEIAEADGGVAVSALTGYNIGRLKEMIGERAGVAPSDCVITSVRHAGRLKCAAEALESAKDALSAGYPHDVAGIDIRDARRFLGEITGAAADEEIVDRIFENFCLGK